MVIFQILLLSDKRVISKERNTVRTSNPRASLTWTDNTSKVGYGNYRPVSPTCVPCKLLEHIVCSNIMAHLDEYKLLSDRQHAFRKRHSCETQLITVINDWAKILDNGGQLIHSLSCLSHILDRFCFGLRLIQAPNKPAGYHSGSGTSRAKIITYQDISSHFFVRVISYHFSGHAVKFINAILLCVKIYLYKPVIIQENGFTKCILVNFIIIISCNTVLCRQCESIVFVCCIYMNKYYYYYNIVEEY